jgi:hypothetical protein
MALLTIPEQYQPGLALLLNSNDKTIETLIVSLRNMPPILTIHSRIAAKLGMVDSIEPEQLSQILDAVLSLYSLRAYTDVSPAELANDIAESMLASDEPGLHAPAKRMTRFRDALVELLQIENLSVGAKALDLLTEHERAYHEARVVTDVRPIFGDDLTSGPGAMVIVHTLKISYHRNGGLEETYIGLDDDDLASLHSVIARAEQKSEGLKRSLDAAKMPYISLE